MRERQSSRLIILDPENQGLLFYIVEPNMVRASRPGSAVFWCTPGGGVEPGETPEDAAIREMHEDTGITGVELGFASPRLAPGRVFSTAVCGTASTVAF